MNEESAEKVVSMAAGMIAKQDNEPDIGGMAKYGAEKGLDAVLSKPSAQKGKSIAQREEALEPNGINSVEGPVKGAMQGAKDGLQPTVTLVKKGTLAKGGLPITPGADGMPGPAKAAKEAVQGAVKKARGAALDAAVKAADAGDKVIAGTVKAGVKGAAAVTSVTMPIAGSAVAKAAAKGAEKGIDKAMDARSAARHAAADALKQDSAKDARAIGSNAMNNLIKGAATKNVAAIATGKDVAKEAAKGLIGR